MGLTIHCVSILYAKEQDRHEHDTLIPKSLFIQKVIALLPRIDENLGRPSAGSSRGKDYSSSLVAHQDRIILNLCVSPLGLNGRIAIDSKLRHKAWKYTKETTSIPKRFACEFLRNKVIVREMHVD